MIVDSKIRQLGHEQRDESLDKSGMGLLLYRYDDNDYDDNDDDDDDDEDEV